jgi:hypothetical protein
MSYTPGQILTADALNASLDAKTDNSAAAITGGTVSGLSSLSVSGTTATTSPTTGALTVAGGVGVGGDVQIGGKAVVGSTVDATSPTTGAVTVAGGVGIAKSVNVGGTTDSTTITTGAVVVAGGVGISKNLNVGQAAKIASTTDSTTTTTGALIVSGGAGVAKNLNVGGATTVASTTDSTTTATGALVVSGGVGVAKQLRVGGLATVANLTLAAAGIITFADGSTQSTSGTASVLLKANNLSDVTSASTSRSNIGAAATSGNLSQFAATTSAQLAGIMSDETGTGALVFANQPTLNQPVINGITSGVAPAAGQIGELISNVNSSPVTLSTGTLSLIASITLTPGIWLVGGNVEVTIGTGGGSQVVGQINTSAIETTFSAHRIQAAFGSGSVQKLPCGMAVFQVSANTPVNIYASAVFPSGTTVATGGLTAIRCA